MPPARHPRRHPRGPATHAGREANNKAKTVVLSVLASMSLAADQANAEVHVAAVMEGSGFNKCLAVRAERGDAPVPLSSLALLTAYNAATEWEAMGNDLAPLASAGDLNPGDAFVVCSSRADQAVLDKVKPDKLSGAVRFNGDDAIAIARAGQGGAWTPVDQVGALGGEGGWSSGSGWTIGSAKTKDVTLVRSSTPTPIASTAEWARSASTQWDVLPKDAWPDALAETASQAPAPSPSAEVSTTAVRPSSAASATPLRFTVAHYNVEWLFDGRSDPSRSPYEGCASCADAHTTAIANALKATLFNPSGAMADIVHFAEVEDQSVLRRLRDQALGTRASEYNTLFVQGRDSGTGQDVAIISNTERVAADGAPLRTDARASTPVPGSKCGPGVNRDDTGVSKNIVARFVLAIPNGGELKLTVVGAHLKAFPTEKRSCAQREGQALVLSSTVQKELADGREVIVLGDFNDFDGTIRDASNNKPTSRVLEFLKDVDMDGTDELENVMGRLPASERFTAWYDRNGDGQYKGEARERSAIDHILVSNNLAQHISDVRFYHNELDPQSTSDHWPIAVTFEIGGDGTNATSRIRFDRSDSNSILSSGSGTSNSSAVAFCAAVGVALALRRCVW